MKRPDRESLLLVTAALFLAALLFPVRARLDAHTPRNAGTSFLYLPDKRLMKILSVGHGPTVSDLAWVKATGYLLDEFKLGKTHIEHLYELFDTMTELDHDFVDAYESGAIFLSSLAQRPDAGERLIDKGEGAILDDGTTARFDPARPGTVHVRHPQRYKLSVLRSSIYLVSYAGTAESGEERESMVRKAGRLLKLGVETYPEKLGEYKEIAARLAERKLSDRQRAEWEVAIWTERAKSGNDLERELGKQRLAEARSEQNRAILNDLVARFVARHKRRPERLEEVVAPVPEDPLGVGYRLEGDHVRARGVEAARLARSLERKVASFREREKRPPTSLEELGAGTLPADLDVSYDAKLGAVRVRPR